MILRLELSPAHKCGGKLCMYFFSRGGEKLYCVPEVKKAWLKESGKKLSWMKEKKYILVEFSITQTSTRRPGDLELSIGFSTKYQCRRTPPPLSLTWLILPRLVLPLNSIPSFTFQETTSIYVLGPPSRTGSGLITIWNAEYTRLNSNRSGGTTFGLSGLCQNPWGRGENRVKVGTSISGMKLF